MAFIKKEKLGSPIELPGSSASNSYKPDSAFVKKGSPFDQLNRFFVGLSPRTNGFSAIEFTEGSPLRFVQHEQIKDREPQPGDFMETQHPNMANLREVFIAKHNVFFLYDSSGVSLQNILQYSSVFQIGELEVATICKGVLRALQYVHEVLGISHGNVNLSTILIDQEGVVKLLGIGKSMVRESKSSGKSQDLEALCAISRALLNLDDADTVRGTVGLLAEDFTKTSVRETVADFLTHPFIRISTGPWCLRPVSVLCGISQV